MHVACNLVDQVSRAQYAGKNQSVTHVTLPLATASVAAQAHPALPFSNLIWARGRSRSQKGRCRMQKSFSPALSVLAIVLCLTCAPAWAGKFNAIVNGKSYHFNSTYDWNEDNYGFGLEHQFEQKSAWRTVAMANGFRDSTDNMSYMAGAGLHRRIYETDRLVGLLRLRRPERVRHDTRRRQQQQTIPGNTAQHQRR